MIKSFEDIESWKQARIFNQLIYDATNNFKFDKENDFNELKSKVIEISKTISGLIKYLKNSI